MCIIVVKPVGVDVPPVSILGECYANNPDGCGFMYANRGVVHGHKGFMTFESFLKSLFAVEQKVPNLKSKAMIFHFRIGTHGTRNPNNTHPFPLDPEDDTYDTFKKLDWSAKFGYAHNGIISKCTGSADIKKLDVSDTMVFGKKWLLPLSGMTDLATNFPILNFVHDVGQSKFAFMDGKGKMSTVGSFVKDNGMLYSNDSYKEARLVKTEYYYTNGYTPPAKAQNTVATGAKTPATGTPTVPAVPAVAKTVKDRPVISIELMEKQAEALRLTILERPVDIICPFEDEENSADAGDAYDPMSGEVYFFSKHALDWEPFQYSAQMALVEQSTGKVLFNSWKRKIPERTMKRFGYKDLIDQNGNHIGATEEVGGEWEEAAA